MASNFSTASPVLSPPPIKKKKLTLLRRVFAFFRRKPQRPVRYVSVIEELLQSPIPPTSAQPPPLPLPQSEGPTAVVSHPSMPTPQMALSLAPYYPPASSVSNTSALTLPPPSSTPLLRYPTYTDTSEDSSEDHDEWDGYTPPSSVHESQFNHNLSGFGAVSNHPSTPIYPQIYADPAAHLNNQFGAVVPLLPLIHHPSTSAYQIPNGNIVVPSNNVLGAHYLPAPTHPQIPSNALIPLNNTTNVAYSQTYEHLDASCYVKKSHTVSYLQSNGNQSSSYVDNSVHITSGNEINIHSSRRQTLQYGGRS